jgi:hypothetical protein
MHIKIEKKALLEAIQKLEAKKPIGKAKKAYLKANVVISLADKTAIFQLELLYVTSSGSTPRFCISPKISHGGAASAGVRNWWRCFEWEYLLIIALKTRRS